jgi:hypothetical protein
LSKSVPSRMRTGIRSGRSAGVDILVCILDDGSSTMNHAINGERSTSEHALDLLSTRGVKVVMMLVRIVHVVFGVVDSEIGKMSR